MKKNIQYVIFAVVVLAIAGGSFYGGMVYKGSQTPVRGSGGQGSRTGGRFANGNNFVTGDITAKDAQSITIKSRDGSSRIIFYSNSTQVGKFVSGALADIQIGQTVMANGTTNSDGSITAQSIQIRPTPPSNTGGNSNQ